MTFRFHKGKHRPRPWYWLRWFILLIKPWKITRQVSFDFSARYDLPDEDQDDRNKLFGISFHFSPHRNSARFGWRYDMGRKKFILSAYCYLNGERVMEDLCDVVPHRLYNCILVIRQDKYRFIVMQSDNGYPLAEVEISKGHTRKSGWLLGPYFGGNHPAPVNMKLTLKKY